MCLEFSVNVGLAAQLDKILSLKNVDTIASLVETSFSFNAHGSTFSLDMCMDLGDEEFGSVGRLSPYYKIIILMSD